MRFISCCLALALIAMATTSLSAQAVYNISGPCSSINYSENIRVLGTNGDRVIFTDRQVNDNYLFISDGLQADGPDTLLLTRQRIVPAILNNDLMVLASGTELYTLRPEEDELVTIFTAPGNIIAVSFFEGDYYVAHAITGTGDNALTRFSPDSGEADELYRITGNIEGIGATTAGMVVVAEQDISFLVRIENDIPVVFDTLYLSRNNTFGGLQDNYFSDGNRFFFFFNNPADGEQTALWSTNGTTGDATELGIYQRDFFNRAIGSVLFQGQLYFERRRIGQPSGFTYDFFRSDGTVAGTFDLDGSVSSYGNPYSTTVYNGYLYYTGGQGFRRINDTLSASISGWSDGRNPGEISDVGQMGTFNDSLIIGGTIPFNDFEPFISDGSHAASRQLANLNDREDQGSDPIDFATGETRAYFWARNRSGRRQVYAYDLTVNPTFGQALTVDSVSVTDISMGSGVIQLFATGTDLAYEIAGLSNTTGTFEPDTAGLYTYTVTDGFGCSVTDTVRVDVETGTSYFSGQLDYRVIPNPVARGTALGLIATGARSDIKSVGLYDIVGRQLRSFINGFSEMEMPDRAGAYVLIGYNSEGTPLGRWRVIVR